MCESVQRGMASRAYTGGWFAPMEEPSLDIRRYVLDRLARTSDQVRRAPSGRPATGRSPRRLATGTSWWSGWGRWAARPPGRWPGPGPGCWGWSSSSSGHHRGASHDHARIIRRSYHTPGYVRLAGLAYQAWEELEREAGERLVVTTGGLDLFPAGSAIPPGPYRASLEACGVPYHWLDAAEVMRRWPAFRLDARRPRPLAGRRRHRPGRPRHPAHAAPGRPATAPPCSTGPR